MTGLTTDGLYKSFGSRNVLQDISITIPSGQITCLLGESGSGKSTLLRLIAGIDQPNAGTIRLGEAVLSGPTQFVEPEERQIGFMFQDYALFPHLSVIENIGFGLKALPRAARKQGVSDIGLKLGITHLYDRYPHALSGGEQQRVALARALAPEPAVLLMDEPFSNLDQGLRLQVRSETVDLLRKLGTTAILVTHDPAEAMATADQIILMQQGKIEQAATPTLLYDAPISPYAAEFMGHCNRISGQLRGGQIVTPLGAFPAPPDLAEGGTAVAVIRPRALSLGAKGSGIAARIQRKLYLGEVEQVDLTVAGLEKPLQLHSPVRLTQALGESVDLSVDLNQVHVFADET